MSGQDPGIRPGCQVDLHRWCPGNYDAYVPGATVPVDVHRCACSCHAGQPVRRVGAGR